MSDTTTVTALPECDLCRGRGVTRQAEYDAKTWLGPWAFMCADDWATYSSGQLGTGHGQQLVVKQDPGRET
jgi:hypothetical protein